MAGLGLCPCFTSSHSCKRYSICSSSITTRSGRQICCSHHPGGDHKNGKKQLRKGGPRHRDLRQEPTASRLWLYNQFRPVKVESQQSTLDAQTQGDLQGRQQATRSESSRPGCELQSMCEEGQLDRAMDVLRRMDQQGILPSLNVYRSLLKGCTKRKVLVQAKRLHAHLVKHELDCSRILGEYLVNMLVKCGDLEGALQAFHRLLSRTAFSWTAVISGYASSGRGKDALKLYRCMQDQGIQPNKYTIIALLRACGSLLDVEEGKRTHATALKYGYESDLFVGTCLVDMYAKCGKIVDAQTVFDGLAQHDVVSWNALLAAYTQEGEAEKTLQLYEQMREEGASPDDRTYVSALRACGLIAEKEEDFLLNDQNTKVKAVIMGKGQAVMSWQLYEQMREAVESPNDRTFVSVLQVCGMLAEKEENVMVDGHLTKAESLKKGKVMHADTCRKGYDSDVFVGSVLVSMYGKCGSILDAQSAFDGLSERNVVSWNAMLAAYAHQGYPEEALKLYEQMQNEAVSPSDRTCVTLLQACGMLAEDEEDILVDGQLIKWLSLQIGKAIHAYVQIRGYNSDAFVGNALLSMYGKCRSIIDVQSAFDGLSKHDVVSWNAILAAYTQQGQAEKALLLYEQMQQASVSPNDRTLVTVLQACGMLAEKGEDPVDGQSNRVKSLGIGKAAHAHAQKHGYDSDSFVGNTLITMYGKCGKIVDAQDVFEGLPHRGVVSWNAMISVCVQQGQPEKALQLYDQLLEEGFSPNLSTFLSAFQACGMLARTGGVTDDPHTEVKFLEKGKAIQSDAWRAGYKTNALAGTSLIRMYGKFGSIPEAQKVFDELPHRSTVVWTAMLNVYAQQGQREKASQLYRQMQGEGVAPDDCACGLAEKEVYFPDGRSPSSSAKTEKAATF